MFQNNASVCSVHLGEYSNARQREPLDNLLLPTSCVCVVCVFVVMKVLSSLLQCLIIVHRFHQRPSPFPNELGQFLFSQSVEILLATRKVPAGSSMVYHSSLVCRSYV